MLFKLANLNSNLALTLCYLNPALKNSAQGFTKQFKRAQIPLIWKERIYLMSYID